MHPMRAAITSLLIAVSLPAATLPLQTWVDEAIAAGGGVVTIPPGEHILPKGLIIKDAKNLSIKGMEREACILRLPEVSSGRVRSAAAAGAKRIEIQPKGRWRSGMQLQLEAPGAVDSFTGKARPYVLARIAEVHEDHFLLQTGLSHPIPEGCLIRDPNAPNLIEVRGKCDGVQIANLILDGGRREGDPAIQGHAQLCALLAQGDYDYRKGPTGPQPSGLVLRDCIIENCFGRGAAFYSCRAPRVEACSFRDCADEAIDFDHFTSAATASGNRIIRCRVGIELNDAEACRIEGNEIERSDIGLHFWRFCPQPEFNRRHQVINNRILGCRGNGMQIAKGTQELLIENNVIEHCGRNGISLGGNHHRLQRNQIQGCRMKAVAINEGQHQITP